VPFDPLRHLERYLHDGKCQDIFKTLIRKGTSVIPGTTSAEDVFNSQTCQRADVEIYRTEIDPPPMYTTECKHVANLQLTFDETTDCVPIRVKIDFGHVNATVSAMKDGPGQQDVVTASINWFMD